MMALLMWEVLVVIIFVFNVGWLSYSTSADNLKSTATNAATTLKQFNDSENDPAFYCDTEELVNSTAIDKAKNETCDLKISDQSANYIKHTLHSWSPNFARLILNFSDSHTCIKKRDIIMPHHWFWTYYSPDGYFPYLKWPIDFSKLSFGLLDAKTYPKNITVYFQANAPNCTLFMGDNDTTKAICEAFWQLTNNQLVKINSRFYSYSYWCFLAERPRERESWDYVLGVYFGFVSDFVGYNCCRTGFNVSSTTETDVLGLTYLHQIRKMRQCTIIPNIISLLIFAYFPLCLSKLGKNNDRANERYQDINQDDDFIFLSENASFTDLTSFCNAWIGVSRAYPTLLSRIRRLVLVLVTPCIIYIQIAVYKDDDTIKSFIRHGMPISYISMVGGYGESRDCFLPCFGGPFVLLTSFYVGCLLFFLIPQNLHSILETDEVPQCNEIFSQDYHRSIVLPFSFGDAVLETLSSIPVRTRLGYSKLAKRCQAGIYMVLNPKFWRFFFDCQFERYHFVRGKVLHRLTGKPKCQLFVMILGSLFYALFCFIEILVCVIYFIIPLFGFVKHIIKCYINYLMRKLCFVRHIDVPEQSSIFKMIRPLVAILVTIPFIFFIISVCTVFSASISYIVLVTVFSFLAVIVYPSYSFGYIFFGIAFLYYFVKRVQAINEIYVELLHDAVEISERIEVRVIGPYFVNETLVVKNVNQETFDKLQVNGRTVELTEFQREVLHETDVQVSVSNLDIPKVKNKNGELGMPRELFNRLVKEYRPIHIQIISAMARLGLILTLIVITLSIVMQGSYQQKAAMSEVIHVIFMVAIGALPRVLEIALSTITDSMKKEIELRRMTATIEQYWQDKCRTTSVN